MAELNQEQYAAVMSNDRRILCLAGAGAGKTATMVERIKRLVSEGVPPESILVLTFTNAAAFNMGERYKRICSSGKLPEFKTFHGFCYSTVIRSAEVRAALGYSTVPGICDDNDFKKYVAQAKLQCNIKMSDELLLSDDTRCLSEKERWDYNLFHKALKRTMLQNNVITFDALSREVCKLFQTCDPCTERFRNKYRYIFVDESQDTDPVQIKFLGSFPSDTNFFLVGDALQNVYGFRGCTNEFIKALSRSSDWSHIRLYKNYRSTRQICNFANRMSTYADPEYRIEMEGQRDGDDVVVIYGSECDYNNPVDSTHLNKLINMLKESNEECAVLCRTNKEVSYICQELKSVGIDFSTSNKTNDDISILTSVIDKEFKINWLSTYLNNSRYSEYIRTLPQISKERLSDWFIANYGTSTKIAERLKKINAVEVALIKYSSCADKYDAIVKLMKTKMKNVEPPEQEIDNESLIKYIIENISDIEEHKIYVGTIHSSKGLEYEHVFLMGVNDGMFELNSEEMKNLYYVGITRAMNHLTVFRR